MCIKFLRIKVNIFGSQLPLLSNLCLYCGRTNFYLYGSEFEKIRL
jgi:hypothetical protein